MKLIRLLRLVQWLRPYATTNISRPITQQQNRFFQFAQQVLPETKHLSDQNAMSKTYWGPVCTALKEGTTLIKLSLFCHQVLHLKFQYLTLCLDLAYTCVAAGDNILPPCCWAFGCMPSHISLQSSTQFSKGAAHTFGICEMQGYPKNFYIVLIENSYTFIANTIHVTNWSCSVDDMDVIPQC